MTVFDPTQIHAINTFLAYWQPVTDISERFVPHTAMDVHGSCEYPIAWSLHVSTGAQVCLQTSCINQML